MGIASLSSPPVSLSLSASPQHVTDRILHRRSLSLSLPTYSDSLSLSLHVCVCHSLSLSLSPFPLLLVCTVVFHQATTPFLFFNYLFFNNSSLSKPIFSFRFLSLSLRHAFCSRSLPLPASSGHPRLCLSGSVRRR